MEDLKLLEKASKYERNFKIILENNYVYPTLNTKNRQEVLSLYADVFGKSAEVSTACLSCMKPYLKELAKWYFAEKKNIDQNEAETTSIEEAPEEKKLLRRGRPKKETSDIGKIVESVKEKQTEGKSMEEIVEEVNEEMKDAKEAPTKKE